MDNDYRVEISESSRELTPKERVSLKSNGGAVKLDEATRNGELLIKPVGYAVLSIHNEKGKDKDYKQYVIFDDDGTKYVTGSKPFFDSFIDIYNELNDETGKQIEDYSLRIFRRPSKNYQGKEFIACDVI